jgi:hypothetical protein
MSSLSIQIAPTPKQHQTWLKLRDQTTTEILFGGGAGGGKSRLGCEWLIESCIRYPESRWLMGRAVLKTLKKTTLVTFFDVAKDWGLKKDEHFIYNQQDGEITFWNGSVIDLKDLAYYPSDPEYDSLGSTEYTGAFIDEANQVRLKAKEIITARLRYKLDQFGLIGKLLMSCNPAKNWVYHTFYKPTKDGTLPDYRAFIQALASDNPFLSKAYLLTLSRIEDKNTKERLVYGNWEYDDDPLALFQTDHLDDLFTNRLPASTDHYITCDAARLGRDKCVIMVWRGLDCVHITSYDTSRLPKIEGEIERLRAAYGVPRSRVIVDEDGVGGGVVDHLEGVKGFVGGSSPIQDRKREQEAEQPGYKVNYENLRAQCYYTLAAYVQESRIAISCAQPEEQETIIAELEQIKGRNVGDDTKLKIVKKDEIKEALGGRSPDYADAISMRMWFELQPEGPEFSIDFF